MHEYLVTDDSTLVAQRGDILYRHRLIFVLVMWLIAIALPAAAQTPTNISTIYLPLVSANTIRPLGFETNTGWLYASNVYPQADNLNAHWVRLNTLSWREAQPTIGSPINWNAPSFTRFEAEVEAANALGLQIMAIIDDHPSWATGSNSICAAILDQYHDEFAAFVRAVVAKYSQAPYYVRYWELGNEPDVDPGLVGELSPFGCWGVIEDEYYGGERYGRMLMTVTPQIRAADPGAKVVFGGLLLARPENGPNNNDGKPFNFLEGALRAGAGPYFDILAFHSYPTYFEEVGVNNAHVDFDKHPKTLGGAWVSRGGATLGKISFLRDVMQRYGINKPLFLNETGLLCDDRYTSYGPVSGGCNAAAPILQQAQANHLIRSSMRAIAAGVESYIWYTLQGPGWRHAGLLDGSQHPRPAYIALKTAIEHLNEVRMPPQSFTGYGAGFEAYRFSGNGFVLDMVWSVDDTPRQITLPASSFIAAYTRDGAPIAPAISGGTATLNVGFENIYLKRKP